MSELPIDQVIHGDCLSVMRTWPDACIDSICVDPPAGISFMNKAFDHNRGGRDKWITWLAEIMREALRCLKPGAHCFVWALPRTSHWTATALEDAGFEIRDEVSHLFGVDTKVQAFMASLNEEQQNAFMQIMDGMGEPSSVLHIQGQGFPKSQNISAMIDKHFKAEREVIGTYDTRSMYDGIDRQSDKTNGGGVGYGSMVHEKIAPITAPSTDLAKKFSGTGSAMKPAHENWLLVRKPLAEKTIVAQVLANGCGGLNIDASRIGVGEHVPGGGKSWGASSGAHDGWKRPSHEHYTENTQPHTSGRFPSNLLLSHTLYCIPCGVHYNDEEGFETVQAYDCHPQCPVFLLDQQSGVRKSGERVHSVGEMQKRNVYTDSRCASYSEHEASTGGASRYFKSFPPDTPPFIYAAKSSRRDRSSNGAVNNTHPTTKSTELMKYLCTLITPQDGIILDCFAGSGSTLVAAIGCGFHFIGIEQDAEYCEIARKRIEHAQQEMHTPVVAPHKKQANNEECSTLWEEHA